MSRGPDRAALSAVVDFIRLLERETGVSEPVQTITLHPDAWQQLVDEASHAYRLVADTGRWPRAVSKQEPEAFTFQGVTIVRGG